MVTQLVLMREALNAFSGDETALGLLLGNWLFLTGMGALIGRWAAGRRARTVLFLCQALAALLPPAMVFALRAWRSPGLAPGVDPGPAGEFLVTLALLTPYGLASGAFLAVAAAALTQRDGPAGIGRIYLADTLGAILGGGAFTFLLASQADPFTALGIAGFANLGAAGLAAVREQRPAAAAGATVLAAGLAAFLLAGPEARSARLHYAAVGQEFVARARSHYGQLDVTRSGAQVHFLYNGQLLAWTGDRRRAEEAVHLVLHLRPRPTRALLIGGAAGGAADEMVRRTTASVTCVELDPLIGEEGHEWSDAIPPACRPVVATDGCLFLRRAPERFDLILLDLPLPVGAQMNRFYTVEFFRTARRALTPGGALAFACGETTQYISPEQADVLACLRATLARVFAHVRVLPGERYHFIASDAPLDGDLRRWSAALDPPAEWIRPGWVEAMLSPDRQDDVNRALDVPAPVNRDFNPALSRRVFLRRIAEHRVAFGAVEAVLLAALLFYLLRLRAAPRAVLTIGFAAAGLEFALLLGFQVLYGSLYRQMGLIVTLFMIGLAAGAALGTRLRPAGDARRLGLLAAAVAGLALLIPPTLAVLNAPRFEGVDTSAAQAVIPLWTLLLGALTGAAFPLAARATATDSPGAASEIFTADFIGAALGALLVSMLLIPLMGLFWTCAATAALNLAAAIPLLRARRVV